MSRVDPRRAGPTEGKAAARHSLSGEAEGKRVRILLGRSQVSTGSTDALSTRVRRGNRGKGKSPRVTQRVPNSEPLAPPSKRRERAELCPASLAARAPPANLKLLNGLERLRAVSQGLFQVLAIGHAQVLEPRKHGRGSGGRSAVYPIPAALRWSRSGR